MIKDARDLFDQIDIQRDGIIDIKELKEYLRNNFNFEPNQETLL